MSVKLTTNLSQRLVLTPQLRQRIEMLQMTSIELSDLIQQQMLENPVLEEVPSQEETRELAEKILDQLANGDPSSSFDMNTPEAAVADFNGAPSNGSGEVEMDAVAVYGEPEGGTSPAAEGAGGEGGDEISGDDEASRDSFEEIDFGR